MRLSSVRKINDRQYFKDIETAYRLRFNALYVTACKHIYNKDLAVDAVHDAFTKATEYFNKHPERKIRENILHWLTIKACKKINKFSREIPVGLFNESVGDK